jgi:hypothetical protein
MTYVDFTVTTGGTAESFNATITCDTSSTSSTSCTFSSTFVGSDGNVHSIDNYTVTGDDTFGYNVSATFYHDTYGEVTIFTSAALTFGACGVYPDGGEIYIESGTGSNIYITFYPSCTYTIVGTDGTATIGPLTGNW